MSSTCSEPEVSS